MSAESMSVPYSMTSYSGMRASRSSGIARICAARYPGDGASVPSLRARIAIVPPVRSTHTRRFEAPAPPPAASPSVARSPDELRSRRKKLRLLALALLVIFRFDLSELSGMGMGESARARVFSFSISAASL